MSAAYSKSVIFIVIPTTIFVIIVFWFCDIFKNSAFGIFMFTGVTIIVLSIIVSLIKSSKADITFDYWIFNGNDLGKQSSFYIAYFVLCCYFVPCAIYYFTSISYKPYYILLLLFIPNVLFFKKQISVNKIILCLTIMSYFMLIYFQENISSLKNTKILNKKNMYLQYLFTGAIFFIISLSITLFTPDKKTKDLNFFPVSIDSDSLGYSKSSGNAAGGNFDLKKEFFKYKTDGEAPYFIRQVFSNYDGTKWNHISDKNLSLYQTNWLETEKYNSFDTLIRSWKSVKNSVKDKKAIELFSEIEKFENAEIKNTIYMKPVNNAEYVIAPLKTFNVTSNNLVTLKNGIDEVRIKNINELYEIENYTINYFTDQFRKNLKLQNFVSKLSFKDYSYMLQIINLYGDNEAKLTSKVLSMHLENAQKVSSLPNSFDSDIIKKIAEKIVAGKKTDYEKALALENYFHNNNFIYDLSFKDNSIESFITNTKRGTCSDYATAMTLMAQAVNLKARYVEGYVTSEKNKDGEYVIRAGNSHAFTQVFIPFYGWVTFEPTVPSYFENNMLIDDKDSFKETIRASATNFFKLISVVSMALLISYLFYMLIITELIFKMKLNTKNNNQAIILAYKKICVLTLTKEELTNTTSNMLTEKVSKQYDIDIEYIAQLYDKITYNNELITTEEKDNALQQFDILYKTAKSKWLKAFILEN